MVSKTGMEPNVVLKDEGIVLRALSNSPPNLNVRFGDCHLSPAHSDRGVKLKPRRKCSRLRLHKKLICQRVVGVNVSVFGRIPQKILRVHSGMPLRDAEKVIAGPISYASKLLLDAAPTRRLAIEVDYVDLFNRLAVCRSLSAECLRRLHRKHFPKTVRQV